MVRFVTTHDWKLQESVHVEDFSRGVHGDRGRDVFSRRIGGSGGGRTVEMPGGEYDGQRSKGYGAMDFRRHVEPSGHQGHVERYGKGSNRLGQVARRDADETDDRE